MQEGVPDDDAPRMAEDLLERWGALPLATRFYGLMLWWRFGVHGEECQESGEVLARVARTSERYVRRMEQQLEALGLVMRTTTPRGRTLSFAAGWGEVQAYPGTGVPRYRRTAVQAYLPPKEEAKEPPSALPAPKAKARKPSSGAHHELVRWWESEHERTRGVAWTWQAKHFPAIARMLKFARGEVGEVRERMTRMLEDEDAWIARQVSPNLLESRWNGYAVTIVDPKDIEKRGRQEAVDRAISILRRKETACSETKRLSS